MHKNVTDKQIHSTATERRGFFFASADNFGCVKVWEMDRKSSLHTFNFEEDRFNAFDAEAPPPIRCIL
jgi:hypothetical protein